MVGRSKCNTDCVEPDNLRILQSLSRTEAALQKYKIVYNLKKIELLPQNHDIDI